jgi:DNA modification methylase
MDCCITSPPYYHLRDYNHPDQIGLEPSLEEYVSTIVDVFREVRRVLKDEGTLWLNLGDTYSGSSMTGGNTGMYASGGKDGYKMGRQFKKPNMFDGLPAKNLLGVPWRVAFALQADGWILRQDIIWSKPNPMPDSAKDRCTKSHEYIFLLSKSPRYYFDQEAILEPCSPNTHARFSQDILHQKGSTRGYGGKRHNGPMKAVGRRYDPGKGNKNNESFDAAMVNMPENRNKRSVWTVAPQPYSGPHYSTFPVKLIEPCVLAGCPVNGTVLDPFAGTGTVGECCRKNSRNAVLIDIHPDNEQLIRERTMLDIPEISSYAEVRP